jgi:homoserine dehydrogenase
VAKPLIVLKFGGSVLTSEDALPQAVSEIYRYVRQGYAVAAVVSALKGETDALIRQASHYGAAQHSAAAPYLIALGEFRSAALLALAAERAGLSPVVRQPHEIGLRAAGDREDAALIDVDTARLKRDLEAHDVVVIPGFTALDTDGRTVLLGRGGTDLSAIFLASRIKGARVRLIKDVDGVYDHDPALDSHARSFARISWAEAEQIARVLIQPKGVRHAASLGLAVEVAAMGAAYETVVGPDTAPRITPVTPPPLRVGLLGCGVVGGGVLERLLAEPERFEVAGVLVRDLGRHALAAKKAPFTDDTALFKTLDLDLFIDAACGIEPSGALIAHFLARGVSVASANKQAVAARLPELQAARADEAELLYSAAVGGSVPLLETAARCRGEDAVLVEGLLNSTSNYVLGRISEGEGLAQALDDARIAGFAEADASDDLEGRDAHAKLRLLAHSIWGRDVDAFSAVEVLDRAPDVGEGLVLKQVARCRLEAGRLTGEVRLESLPADHFLAAARAEENRLRIVLSDGRELRASGKGAGRWPTTEAVMADVLDLARRHAAHPRPAAPVKVRA